MTKTISMGYVGQLIELRLKKQSWYINSSAMSNVDFIAQILNDLRESADILFLSWYSV